MNLSKDDIAVLNQYLWRVECESPPEIVHDDGSRATGQAVIAVLMDLHDQEQEKEWELLDDEYDDEDWDDDELF